MLIEEVKKRIQSYAEEIHWVPLKDDLDKRARELIEAKKNEAKTAIAAIKAPQKSLLDFCYMMSKEDNLSDCQLKRGDQVYK
jgi:hypothetical protein